ncbi:MAG: hypothetical protein JSR66_33670 [Proteobacteria bacterium]|nr:hypothetical protein [Pseudomonadota bacterium]
MNLLPAKPVHELVGFQPSAQLPVDVEALQIAADRWLVIGSPPASLLASATFAVTEVTGKWREFHLSGPSASRLLASCVDVDRLLAERDCARTTLFDCPAVLRKLNDGYSIWIERSYLQAFTTAAEQAGGRQ